MTVVSLLSVKGAPGVTTLSCLVASLWAGPGPVAVVEADPAGGDLAARFGLTSTLGWTSLAAAGSRPSAARTRDWSRSSTPILERPHRHRFPYSGREITHALMPPIPIEILPARPGGNSHGVSNTIC